MIQIQKQKPVHLEQITFPFKQKPREYTSVIVNVNSDQIRAVSRSTTTFNDVHLFKLMKKTKLFDESDDEKDFKNDLDRINYSYNRNNVLFSIQHNIFLMRSWLTSLTNVDEHIEVNLDIIQQRNNTIEFLKSQHNYLSKLEAEKKKFSNKCKNIWIDLILYLLLLFLVMT
ncbi:Hypothetical_protein [Hexamita inflata]|uniref:Hypothetical_protein n=1 Tax=Hexamita inflata TaxID=28002 RepID=A0AA86U5B2_9EUKA|nr:Hypothetical protein HINF_LOCUS18558 [Hexamita inflata]